jgi:hypothetical protein
MIFCDTHLLVVPGDVYLHLLAAAAHPLVADQHSAIAAHVIAIRPQNFILTRFPLGVDDDVRRRGVGCYRLLLVNSVNEPKVDLARHIPFYHIYINEKRLLLLL